jgi:serine/threonine-protein kinase
MGLGVSTLIGTMRDVDTHRLGPPPYLAPEQLGVAAVADALTDVWGIGLLLFEMLVGRRAFEGASADEVARLIVAPRLVRVREHRVDVPVAVDRIVSATLARSREQRLSLRDLRRALLDLMQGELAPPRAKTARIPIVPKLPNLGEPCDDAEGTTDLHLHIETDLDSL